MGVRNLNFLLRAALISLFSPCSNTSSTRWGKLWITTQRWRKLWIGRSRTGLRATAELKAKRRRWGRRAATLDRRPRNRTLLLGEATGKTKPNSSNLTQVHTALYKGLDGVCTCLLTGYWICCMLCIKHNFTLDLLLFKTLLFKTHCVDKKPLQRETVIIFIKSLLFLNSDKPVLPIKSSICFERETCTGESAPWTAPPHTPADTVTWAVGYNERMCPSFINSYSLRSVFKLCCDWQTEEGWTIVTSKNMIQKFM